MANCDARNIFIRLGVTWTTFLVGRFPINPDSHSVLCAIRSDDEFVHKSRSSRNEYYRVLMVASRPFGTRPDPSAYFRLPERDGGFSGVSCLHRESVSERPPRAN